MFKRLLTCLFILALTLTAVAARRPAFRAGKDYQIIHSTAAAEVNPNDKIQVIEFFSYGCPWCNILEGPLETWLAKKPKGVTFKRVPVVFEKGWNVYAKAYFIAKALDVDKKISPKIFDAIHNKKVPLQDEAEMQAFFLKHSGVDETSFKSAWNFSPGIDMQINRSFQLMRTYKIHSVPTIVVAGKYKTNSNQRFRPFSK